MPELDSNPKSIQSIYSWYSEGKLFVNRRYQRKLVWTLDEKQKLIESILKKYPVPAILLAERGSGSYEIIDGLQRLHTIVSFVETAFPSHDGKNFDVSQFPTAKLRRDNGDFDIEDGGDLLSPAEVATFLDYSVAISVMRGASEADIDDVFGRINTYGHQLSDQERRQAGVQDDFSNLVREVACELRGDASSDILTLGEMPAISIDLPKTKHGYAVVADQVFWVKQGILRSTDLRDSMDEQCIADIAASIIGGKIVNRSKEAMDAVYETGNSEKQRISDALEVYGTEKFGDELKYCVAEMLEVCNAGAPKKLRDIIFTKPTSNAFPATFAVLVIAFHEALIGGKKKIGNYEQVKKAITGLNARIDTGRRSATPDERRANVNSIKGLIAGALIDSDLKAVYNNHSAIDIESLIRRSELELPNYELKQGILVLNDPRKVDPGIFGKVVQTLCAIANNGKDRPGSLIVGVTDKDSDAKRIESLDQISPIKVGSRFVVGVKREAKALGQTTEAYFTQWRDAVRNSELSDPLKGDVLSNMDYNDYFGLGLVVITVPAQKELSYVGDKVFWREGDQTVEATNPKKVAELAARFF
ncbi:DUF262 domain-containing protein [Pseudarthrobacter enclensis]|uniref:DUF262 domain-containing protein n=1 Tax=Pseudarthrobacter enclensis TaxID=993070 RepID=UPI00342C753B